MKWLQFIIVLLAFYEWIDNYSSNASDTDSLFLCHKLGD